MFSFIMWPKWGMMIGWEVIVSSTGLPIPLEEIKQWNNLGSVDFNPQFSPEDIINEGISDPTQMIHTLLSSHMKVMSFRFPFSVDASIRHVVKSLVQLTATLLAWVEVFSSCGVVVLAMKVEPMGDSSYRLSFEQGKKNEIQHHN
jgi:hypothetical protein